MKKIFTIAKKEFTDTLRDRRTVITMIIVPLLLFPVIMNIFALVQRDQLEKAQTKTLNIAIKGSDHAEGLVSVIENTVNMAWHEIENEEEISELIRSDSIDVGLVISPAFKGDLDSMNTAALALYYQAVDNDRTKRRILTVINNYEQELLSERLGQLKLRSTQIDPISINEINIATDKEIIGTLVGGFLPYLFILFCFFGCYYPAVDLFTGEKERGTLETMLTLPVDRKQILLGKMIVVASSGLLSALLALLGLLIGLNLIEGLPDNIMNVVRDIVKPLSVTILLSLLIPIAIFFAGMLIPIATRAKTFKEAQSQITPLNFLVIIPAALGLLPGISLNWSTVWIPILNVALAVKEVIAGTIDYTLLVVVFVLLIALAGVGILLSVRSFSHESNVLQS